MRLSVARQRAGCLALEIQIDLWTDIHTHPENRAAVECARIHIVLADVVATVESDTQAVAEVLRWGMVQLPFYFSGLVLLQLLASQGRYGTIALFAASNLVVKLVLNPALSVRMGIAGIALATALMYAWSASCLCYAALRSKAGK